MDDQRAQQRPAGKIGWTWAAAAAVGLLTISTRAAEPQAFEWSDPANWQCGLVPGDTQGIGSTTEAEAKFAAQGVAHFKVIVDQGRAVNRLVIGTGYVLGETTGPALSLVGKNARIFPNVAGEGPVTIDAPLNLSNGLLMQTLDKTPVIFNGNINGGSGRVHVFNSSAEVTFNGVLTNGTYTTNGGDAVIHIKSVNRVPISQDVTRTTVMLERAGAVTDAPISAGRGGNFVLAVPNALTGSGGIRANAEYFGTGLYGTRILIDADNNYTGDTIVNGLALLTSNPDDPQVNALLRVNNGPASKGSATGSGDVIISGGMLAGNGRIANTGKDKGVTLGNRSTKVGDGATGVAQGRLSPGADDNQVGVLVFDLGGKGLDISQSVADTNTSALRFDLARPESSDQVRLLKNTLLRIGEGKLEFDDFEFHALEGFGPGRYVLFTSAVLPFDGSLGTNLSGTINGHSAKLSLARRGCELVLVVSGARN